MSNSVTVSCGSWLSGCTGLRSQTPASKADVATRVGTAFRRWNNGMPNPVEWPLPRQAWSGWQEWAGERSRQWAEVPDLTTQLLAFVRRQALSNRLASDPDQPEDTEAQ